MNVKTPHNRQMEETIKQIKTKDPKLFQDIREESGIDETYFEKKE
jgi:hypothetical protein